MSEHQPAVSARGVLDGDPAALAGLCDLRGPSVIAYCESVCGPAAAVDAAAAAFGAFRSTAINVTRPLALNPDALLLAKARQAAAERAPDPAGGAPRRDDPLCPDVPRLLAGLAQNSLSPPERHHLRRHLARCVSCRGAQHAQQAAERAYVHPPVATLAPIARQAIIAALRHAGPIPSATPTSVRLLPTGPPPAEQVERARAAAAIIRATPHSARAPSLPNPPAPALPADPPPADAADQPYASPTANGPSSPTTARPSFPTTARPSSPTAAGPSSPTTARPPATAATPPPTRRAASPAQETRPRRHPAPTAEASTGVIPVEQIAAALGYGGPPPEAPGPQEPPPPPVKRAAGRGAALGQVLGRLPGRLPSPRVLAPAAVLVVAFLVILTIAGVFSSGPSRAPSPAPAGPTSPAALGGTTTIPPATGPHSLAAHRARLRAARHRRALRARAAAAAAAKASGGAAKTGAAAPPAAPGAQTATPTATVVPPATAGPPTARALAAPAAGVPPNNGAAPAASGGYRAD